MRLRLRPEEQTELAILAAGMLATWLVQEITAAAIRWHVDAHAADADATRLRAENDQLSAHNARLDRLVAAQQRNDTPPAGPSENRD